MSNQPLPDQAARDFIVSNLDVNLLVEAGAGSGKTESLAQRMVAGIASGRCRVGEMAAVTFTRKAAAELRGRFQAALEKRLGDEGDEDAKARISKALSDLETLFAGTIHSFCARLLRERPVEAGLAPGFTEADEVDDAELRKKAWRDFLARERAHDSALLRELSDAGVKTADLDDAFGKVCSFEEVAFPPGDAQIPDTAAAWKALGRFMRQLEKPVPDPIPDDTTCKVQERWRDCQARLRVVQRDKPGDLAELLRRWEPEFKIVQKYWSDDPQQKKKIAAEVEQAIRDFQASTVGPFLAAWRQYVYRLAMTLLVEARGFARAARYRALQLNYGDLLQGAAKLLREHPGVRRVLQRKYRWLYVDEFQDTDPIQAEVVLWLASDEATPSTATDPFSVRLRPGSLFIVGDPKQSIYRFRRADIEIYNRVRGTIENNGGTVLSLVASWRAVSALCEWVSDAFRNVFPPAPTAHQPKFQDLRPVSPKLGGGVRVLTHPETLKSVEVIAADAAAIARHIRSECDAGRRQPGDFLILTSKKKRIRPYAAALEALQVPLEVSGAGAFGDSAEVAAIASLLHALGDPDDAVGVVSVLRGLLFGVSDQELFAHKQLGGWFTLRRQPAKDEDGEPGNPRVNSALRSLSEMASLTRALPAPAAVERILESTGFMALAAARTPGGAEAGDLMHAVDRVREVMEGGGTLADAAEVLAENIDAGDVESWPLEPGRTDVVRVMNLHKAKGLEAPVVFLADPCGGYESQADIRIDRTHSGAVGYLQIVRKQEDRKGADAVIGEPAGWPAHQAVEQPFLDAEVERLRYVAATRARDVLVISRWAKHGRNQPWAAFDPFLVNAAELAVPAAAAAADAPKVDLSERTRVRLAAARDAKLETAKTASFSIASVTGAIHRDIVPREDDPARLLRGSATGAPFGDLVHKLLEFAMRHRAGRVEVERFANWITFQDAELRPAVPDALAAVERVMASEVWRLAQQAAECDVEVPFTLVTKGADLAPALLAGVIDLAFRDEGGWCVVDYKTDQLPEGGAAELLVRHAAQLESYRKAWTELSGESTVRVGVHAVRTGETVWMD